MTLLPADKDMPDYLAGALAYWHWLSWRDLPKMIQVEGWVDARDQDMHEYLAKVVPK